MTIAEERSLPLGLKRLVAGVLIVGVIAGLGLYHVWYQHRIRELGRQLSVETVRHRELLEQQRKLQLDLASTKQADDVRREAMERFDMKIPSRHDYIVVAR
jgi:cell division protein FtsL